MNISVDGILFISFFSNYVLPDAGKPIIFTTPSNFIFRLYSCISSFSIRYSPIHYNYYNIAFFIFNKQIKKISNFANLINILRLYLTVCLQLLDLLLYFQVVLFQHLGLSQHHQYNYLLE